MSIVKMKLQSTATALDYMGFNSRGHGIRINANGEGISPMENLLLSVAACSCVDIEILLPKMRNTVDNVEVSIEGDRADDVTPRPFISIHLHYDLYGTIKEKSAANAVSKAVEKFCSVSACLDRNIKISHSFEIHDGIS